MTSNMYPGNYKRIIRVYGVDFGSHSISISKVEVDHSPVMPYDEKTGSKVQISYLTDSIGKTTIFNGIQYVTPHSDCDTSTFYKRRRMGNECVRHKSLYSISPAAEDAITEQQSGIPVTLPDGSDDCNEKEVTIDYNVARASIATLIREVIDLDIKNSIDKGDHAEEIRVVFALPSWYNTRDVEELRAKIDLIFRLDGKGSQISLEYITSSHAMAFARFNQVFSNYLQYDRFGSSGRLENPTTEETKVMILNAGHNSTEIMEVRTRFDKIRGTYFLDVTKKLRYSFGGAEMDFRICDLVKARAYSKDVEKVKHDLSMFQTARYYGGDRTYEINRSSIYHSCASFERMIEGIKQFILASDCDTIELAGGFSRSYVIQNLLQEITDHHPNKKLNVMRGLSADEVTSLGAGIYGAISALKKGNVVFSRPLLGGPVTFVGNSKITNPASTVEYKPPIMSRQIDPSGTYGIVHRYTNIPSSDKITLSPDSEHKIQAIYGNQNITVQLNTTYPVVDVYFTFDLLDRLNIVQVTERGFGTNIVTSSVEKALDLYPPNPDEIEKVEREFRKIQNMHERICNLYNKMEEFYFDRDKYAQKKATIMANIDNLRNSYMYSVGQVTDLERKYRKLLDAYEFCRIVAVEPDMLNKGTYTADPEVVIDPRLSREVVDQILRTPQGLETMESMISNF